MTAKKTKLTFEEGMDQLEMLIEKLSGGMLTLDETMKTYEEGVALSAQLEKELAQYKRRIEMIDPDTAEIIPFEEDDYGVF